MWREQQQTPKSGSKNHIQNVVIISVSIQNQNWKFRSDAVTLQLSLVDPATVGNIRQSKLIFEKKN